jgi:hypothetical protein
VWDITFTCDGRSFTYYTAKQFYQVDTPDDGRIRTAETYSEGKVREIKGLHCGRKYGVRMKGCYVSSCQGLRLFLVCRIKHLLVLTDFVKVGSSAFVLLDYEHIM